MEGLVLGRIVYFVFDAESAEEVNRCRRTLTPTIAERIAEAAWPPGAQRHIGNYMAAGDICPAMVVRVESLTNVNLKVMLDGTDVYWATSVEFDPGKRHRSWHWMFEGQAARYTPDRPA